MVAFGTFSVLVAFTALTAVAVPSYSMSSGAAGRSR
jgi:hypothetical protein